jgi:hypothetical protein
MRRSGWGIPTNCVQRMPPRVWLSIRVDGEVEVLPSFPVALLALRMAIRPGILELRRMPEDQMSTEPEQDGKRDAPPRGTVVLVVGNTEGGHVACTKRQLEEESLDEKQECTALRGVHSSHSPATVLDPFSMASHPGSAHVIGQAIGPRTHAVVSMQR